MKKNDPSTFKFPALQISKIKMGSQGDISKASIGYKKWSLESQSLPQ